MYVIIPQFTMKLRIIYFTFERIGKMVVGHRESVD